MHAITIFALLASLFVGTAIYATPASSEMIDGNGCHSCQRVCEKFGISSKTKHCHIFLPNALAIYTRASQGSATNPETMYAQNLLTAMDYVSLSEDRKELLVGVIKKNIVGTYKIIAQSCGLGDEPIVINNGHPAKTTRVFSTNLNANSRGLFTVTINKQNLLGIGTANDRFLVIDNNDEIICGGQFIKEKFYLFCQSHLTDNQRVGKGGYCRTSLVKE